jgi:hypothetical protein
MNMKTQLCFSFLATLLLAGCGDKSSDTASGTNATSSSVASAPADYLRAAVKGEQDAQKTVDTASLDKAISMFNIDKGRYPKDLNELVQEKYIPKIPPTPYGTKLSYDANTGRIAVVKE